MLKKILRKIFKLSGDIGEVDVTIEGRRTESAKGKAKRLRAEKKRKRYLSMLGNRRSEIEHYEE